MINLFGRIQLHRIFLISFLIALSACSKFDTTSENIAEDASKFSACSDFNEKLLGTLTDSLLENKTLPTKSQVENALRRKFVDEKSQTLVDDFLSLYEKMTTETEIQLQTKTSNELLAAMTALQIGDKTTPERETLVVQLQQKFSAIQSKASQLGLGCQSPPANDNSSAGEINLSSKLNPVLSGALRVMTTAYQSCSALALPAITSSTPNTKGITVVGNHPEGGLLREVTNLAALNSTHYYIKEGTLNGASCFAVNKNPLIYDFGGKPYATSSDTSALDLFKDGGDGTKVLGIDCSGYVFSSMAVSGLRVAPNKKLKASLVYGISSSMMMDPANNGLSCLAPISLSNVNSIQSGDILAVNGHVVILRITSTDPFALSRAKNLSDCNSTTLSSNGFNFEILQSSPVKEGIGLDRILAKDYVPSSTKINSTLQSYAISACYVKFGKSPGSAPSTGRIIRHKGTAECLDKPLALERESCVQSCYAGQF